MNNNLETGAERITKMPVAPNNKISELDNCFETIDFIDNNCNSDKWRHHYKERQLKAIKDNGVAKESPITGSSDDPLRTQYFLLRSSSSKTMPENQISQSIKNTISGSEVDIRLGSMRRLTEQEERLSRLEALVVEIHALIKKDTNTGITDSAADDVDRIIQFTEKQPTKIIIQYFLNTGKKMPPRIKLELKHKVRDGNKKAYYKTYQTLFGNCYHDYGLFKLDKMAKLSINETHDYEIQKLRDLISDISRRFSDDGDLMATFFYNVDTSEVFSGAFVFVNKVTMSGLALFNNGHSFIDEELEFVSSKGVGNPGSADGYYAINHDRLSVIFDCGDSRQS